MDPDLPQEVPGRRSLRPGLSIFECCTLHYLFVMDAKPLQNPHALVTTRRSRTKPSVGPSQCRCLIDPHHLAPRSTRPKRTSKFRSEDSRSWTSRFRASRCQLGQLGLGQQGAPPGSARRLRLYPIVTLERTATGYERKPGIKWLGGTAKWQLDMTLPAPGAAVGRGRALGGEAWGLFF